MYGEDSRESFKIHEMGCYQTIIKNLEKMEDIKENYYIYQDKYMVLILLYEIAKKFAVMYELLLRKSKGKSNSFKTFLVDIFGNKFLKVRKLVKKRRKWPSIYKKDQKSGKIGFTTLKFKIDRRKALRPIEKDIEFEELIQEISLFGKKCLDLISI